MLSDSQPSCCIFATKIGAMLLCWVVGEEFLDLGISISSSSSSLLLRGFLTLLLCGFLTLLLHGFLMLLLCGFQCSWGISWFGNFDLLLLLVATARIPDVVAVQIPMFLRNFLIWEFRSPPPRCCCADSWQTQTVTYDYGTENIIRYPIMW
jgi:hypothetical protein